MKLIITEQQYRLLIESNNDLIPFELISYGDENDANIDSFKKVIKRYEKMSKKGGFDGIRLTDLIIYFFHFDMETIPYVKRVDGSLICRFSDLITLGDLESVGGNLMLTDSSELRTLGQLKFVGGDLDIENCSELRNLGNLEEVKTIIGLDDTMITDLGKLKKINWLAGHNTNVMRHIESLGDLEYVDRYIDLTNSKIKTLGNLEYVGDYLSLVDSTVEDLGNLKYVGGNLSLMRTPLAKRITEKEIRSKINVEGRIYLD